MQRGSTPREGTQMRPKPRNIPEREYSANFDQCLLTLARMIATSGLTLVEIAKATRLKWDTVYAASQRRPIRLENACRLRYFLEDYKHSEPCQK